MLYRVNAVFSRFYRVLVVDFLRMFFPFAHSREDDAFRAEEWVGRKTSHDGKTRTTDLERTRLFEATYIIAAPPTKLHVET